MTFATAPLEARVNAATVDTLVDHQNIRSVAVIVGETTAQLGIRNTLTIAIVDAVIVSAGPLVAPGAVEPRGTALALLGQ